MKLWASLAVKLLLPQRMSSAVCSHLLMLVPCSQIFLPWRWRRYIPPKRQFTQDLHSITSQKMTFFIVTAVKASNLTYCYHIFWAIRCSHLTISTVSHSKTKTQTLSSIFPGKNDLYLENMTIQMGKVKGNLQLCLIKHHFIKMYRRVKV
jgi:hypothetical protein